MEEDVEGVFLDWHELSKIYHLDLSKHQPLIKYRDLFIVGCLTGLRFSDYSTLSRNQLKNGMLHVRQNKTGAMVVVPSKAGSILILPADAQPDDPVLDIVLFFDD